MADYSFTPQFANLAGLQPLPALDVTRGGALQFQPLQAIQVASAQPELVGQSIAGAIQNIAGGALSGITAKYEEKKAAEREQLAHEREMELYGAKKRSENEDFYQKQRAAFIAENSQRIDFPEKLAAFDSAYSGIRGRLPEIQPKEKPKEPASQPIPTPVEVDLPTGGVSEVPATTEQPLAVDFVSKPAGFGFGFNVGEEKQKKALEEIGAPQVITRPLTEEPLGEDLSQLPAPQKRTTTDQPTQPQPAAVSPSIDIPTQPADPAAPRVVPVDGFTDEAKANSIAMLINQTSPISQVEVKYRPDKAGFWIVPKISEPMSPAEQEKNRIAQQEFEFKKAAAAREVEAAASEKLAKDEAYLSKMKNAIQTNEPTLQTIDNVIGLIEKYQDNFIPIVGLRSQFLTGDLGPLGKAGVALLGGQAADDAVGVRELIEGFKAPSRWNGLMALKEMSPTGSTGAGALSNVEGDSLERLQGSLNPDRMKSDEIIDRLYYIRNGAIKATMNAYRKIKRVDPTYPKPFSPSLTVNPKIENEYFELDDQINNADEEFKKTKEYNDLVQRRDILGEEILKIEDANKLFFPERFDKKTLVDEKNNLIKKMESGSQEYKNSDEYQQDLARAKELLRLIK